MNPKISIIVPVYKVEQYLNKCVDSILSQTFTDFELILVDDGSPDRCGEICDQYALSDSRIRVVHKENGGQASARNLALDIAKGDYIGFVDSDDWIEEDMYELLYNLCLETQSDIANCTSIIHYEQRKVQKVSHPLIIHNRKEAMRTMLEGELYDEVVWTKLFKRSLLNEIRFPIGIAYEDTAFTYKVIHKSNVVSSIGTPKYHYIKRNDSTMDRAIKNLKIDGVLIYDEMYGFIKQFYPELTELVALKLANTSMVILNLLSIEKNFLKFKEDFYHVSSILNSYYNTAVKLQDYPVNVKLLLTANRIHPYLYRLLINLISKRRSL